MAIETFANNATSTLSGAINNLVTTVPVTDGSKYPATGQFRIKVNNELMLCTARVGNNLTVTRAQEGTSAAAHGAGDQVFHIITAGALSKLKEDVEDAAETTMLAAVGALETQLQGEIAAVTSGVTANEYVKSDSNGDLTSAADIPLADLANAGGSAGDLAYWNGTNWVRLAVGTAGRIFAVNTGGTAPLWSNALVVGATSLTIGVPETVNGARTTGDAKAREDELTTSAAGAQTLLSVPIPTDSALVLDVEVLGIEAGAIGMRWFKKSLAYLNDGGVITVGTQRDVDSETIGTPTNAWTVALDADSGNARVQVDGVGTEQVKWYIVSQRVRVTAA